VKSLTIFPVRGSALAVAAVVLFCAVFSALGRAQQEKAFDETLLSQQEASWHASQSGQNPETDDQQLVVLQDQLAALRSKYTDEHPDVVKLKARIADLKNKIATAPPVEEKK